MNQCYCGCVEDDSTMVCCDVCNSFEHLTCRGHLKPPEGQHECLHCRNKGTITEDIRILCLKRRLLDHLRDLKTVSREGLVRVLGKNSRSHLTGLWDFARQTFKEGKGVSIDQEKVKDLWVDLYHCDYSPAEARKRSAKPLKEVSPNQPPPYPACVSDQNQENFPPPGKQKSKRVENIALREENGRLKEEIATLKRKIIELEEENDSASSSSSSSSSSKKAKEGKFPGNLEEQKSFVESLREIVGDSVSGAAREVLDLIHRKKQIGTAGYVKLYEKAYGTSQYNCLCGKGPLGQSGIYRHTRRAKDIECHDCHTVPVEYYTVLTEKAISTPSLD